MGVHRVAEASGPPLRQPLGAMISKLLCLCCLVNWGSNQSRIAVPGAMAARAVPLSSPALKLASLGGGATRLGLEQGVISSGRGLQRWARSRDTLEASVGR